MIDCATNTTRFATLTGLALEAAFDGGRLTSDGELPWLSLTDAELGVCQAIAQHVPEWRGERVRHSLLELVRQRVYQIACGYEDQNDSGTLRSDPLLKVACGRLPDSEANLASQPTMLRLENAVTARASYHIAQALGDLYVRERGKDGPPERIVLDCDSTDDPTHGDQEGSSYHGYYRQHMYHPLLVFDGDTGQLITALLRPGNTHASGRVVTVLRRIVARSRQAWPGVAIELRADAGFVVPVLYEYCEAEGITYTIGLITNARPQELASPLLERAQQQYDAEKQKVRLLAEGRYQAESGDRQRRVVHKVEVMAEGTNTRFVVTTREQEPARLYDWYVGRGKSENWIKDFKSAVKAGRLSCHRFWANQFRLLLHAAAYWLLDALRRKLVAMGTERMQPDTLRLRLIKIGGRVHQMLRCVKLHLA